MNHFEYGYPLLYYIPFFDLRYRKELFFLLADSLERQSGSYRRRYIPENPCVLVEGEMADYISSYVVSHPEEMVAILDDEEIVLAHDIIAGGKGTVLWKRHLLKYHHLKCMVWVVVNTANRGKDGFVMLDEISEAFAPYIEQRYGAAKENMKSAKSKHPHLVFISET